jgi:hypothetical protein
MRNRRAEETDGSWYVNQAPVALTEYDEHEQSTTIVLSKQRILCSSISNLNNVQKDRPHLNDPGSHCPPPNTSSVEELQVRSRSLSPHLAQKADHLVRSADHESTSSASHSPIKPVKDLAIGNHSRCLFPASPLGRDNSSDTCFANQAHFASYRATATERQPASLCRSGPLIRSNPDPLLNPKCQARAVTIEDGESHIRYSAVPQPVEPPLHLVYLESQRLLKERQFLDRFHHFSCRCLVTGS